MNSKYSIIITYGLYEKVVLKGFPAMEGAITAEEVETWLREEHNILINIGTLLNGDYNYYGSAYKTTDLWGKNCCRNCGNNYENVLFDIIEQALTLINND